MIAVIALQLFAADGSGAMTVDAELAEPSEFKLPKGTQGIVFDCDGTLIDTMSLHWKSWQEACARFGLTITLQWWQAQAGKPAEEILDLLCQMRCCTSF